MEKKKKPELSPDQQLHLFFHLIDRITSVVKLLVKAGMWVGLAMSAARIVEALAGKTTSANLDLSLETNTNIVVELFSKFNSQKYAWMVAIVFIIYSFREKSLRRRKTKYLQGRINKLEKSIDPNRESSGLTPTGETNEDDEQ